MQALHAYAGGACCVPVLCSLLQMRTRRVIAMMCCMKGIAW